MIRNVEHIGIAVRSIEQARGFYEKRGYRCFGELTEYPPGFARYFMTKPL